MWALILKKFDIAAELIDGVMLGEIYNTPHHPSAARFISLRNGLRDDAWALNVSNNCASGMEAVISALRQILCKEADIVLVVGQDSTTQFPIWLEHTRSQAQTATTKKLYENIGDISELKDYGIQLIDGSVVVFHDPNIDASMTATAEILSQNMSIGREVLDNYAAHSFRNARSSWESGRIMPYVYMEDGFPVMDEQLIKKQVVFKKPKIFSSAPSILGVSQENVAQFYESYKSYLSTHYEEGKKLHSTALNCSPKSDGAACILVASDKGRLKLKNMEPALKARSWAREGVAPEFMGLGMAASLESAAKRASLELSAIDQFEIHEAFAATALASYQKIAEHSGLDLSKELGTRLNPNGGTIAIGHALGGTGVRLLQSCQQALQENPKAQTAATSMCAGGGVGVSMVVEKV